eukprot:m51a1_g6812 putative tbc1 domain family member 9 (750) ;mRNA; r:267595-270149
MSEAVAKWHPLLSKSAGDAPAGDERSAAAARIAKSASILSALQAEQRPFLEGQHARAASGAAGRRGGGLGDAIETTLLASVPRAFARFTPPPSVVIPEGAEGAQEGHLASVPSAEAHWSSLEPALSGEEKIEKTRQLRAAVRKWGIPAHLRGRAWLRLTEAVTRLYANKGYYWHLVNKYGRSQSVATQQIEKDVLRTHIGGTVFQSEVGRDSLRRVLTSYSWYNTSVGYCQAMNIIAALLLLHMKEEEAFWMLVTIIEDVVPMDYYTDGMSGVVVDMQVVNALAKSFLPRLMQHLEETLGLSLDVFVNRWFLSLFCNVLPIEAALRVLDIILFEGDRFMFRLVLGMLRINEKALLQMKSEEALVALRDMPTSTPAHTLLETALGVHFASREKVAQLRADFRSNFVPSPIIVEDLQTTAPCKCAAHECRCHLGGTCSAGRLRGFTVRSLFEGDVVEPPVQQQQQQSGPDSPPTPCRNRPPASSALGTESPSSDSPRLWLLPTSFTGRKSPKSGLVSPGTQRLNSPAGPAAQSGKEPPAFEMQSLRGDAGDDTQGCAAAGGAHAKAPPLALGQASPPQKPLGWSLAKKTSGPSAQSLSSPEIVAVPSPAAPPPPPPRRTPWIGGSRRNEMEGSASSESGAGQSKLARLFGVSVQARDNYSVQSDGPVTPPASRGAKKHLPPTHPLPAPPALARMVRQQSDFSEDSSVSSGSLSMSGSDYDNSAAAAASDRARCHPPSSSSGSASSARRPSL